MVSPLPYQGEIGTIIRSLGCCPSEGELHDLLAEVEEEEPTGFIRFERFLPLMTKVLLERRYRPAPEDVLLRAFEVLDKQKRGYLTKEDLTKYMTLEGNFLVFLSSSNSAASFQETGLHCNCESFKLVTLFVYSTVFNLDIDFFN
ncbi:dynein regulatory complex protein 8 isoform X3 [Ambystoma mexicanum]|uniref:dynein regulatory complex protein 8 isoform X3 n=1 Tax=Ambystoma mexicanum TaxID=8296 RepID=UPI0037E7ED7D